MAMKKNIVKAPAATKAEVPKPAPPATTNPKIDQPAPRPIMSADSQPRFDSVRPTPPNRGPQTGQDSMSDGDFIAQFSTPEERARWRKEIEQRRQQPQPLAFFRCTNPSCRVVMRDRPGPGGDPCVKCNLMRRTTGGHFVRMSDREVDEHLYQEGLREKVESERRALARLAIENQARARSGRPELTLAEFTAMEKAEFEQVKAAGRQLGQVADLYRPRPK